MTDWQKVPSRKRLVGVALALTMACWLVNATASPAAPPEKASERKPRLVLHWHDPQKIFSLGSPKVGEHVKKLFRRMGLETTWKMGEVITKDDPDAAELSVILLRWEPSTWGQKRHVMAISFVRDEARNTIYIFFPSVARTLGYEPNELLSSGIDMKERMELARALSRVVAHEVVHTVAPELPHDDKGLMHNKLRRSYLLSAKVVLPPQSLRCFHLRLRALSGQLRATDVDASCSERLMRQGGKRLPPANLGRKET